MIFSKQNMLYKYFKIDFVVIDTKMKSIIIMKYSIICNPFDFICQILYVIYLYIKFTKDKMIASIK